MSQVGSGRRRRSMSVAKSVMAGVAGLIALAPSRSAFAASATWNGSADPTWANGANWTPSAAPGSVGPVTNTDTALFNSAGNGNTAITVDSGRNIENITFDTASAAPYVLSGGNLIGTNGGEIQMTPSVVNSQTFSSPFTVETSFTFANNSTSPTAALNYNGSVSSGTLTLSGSNTASNSIGSSTGTITSTLVKTGSGTWTITGTSATTYVYQGTLRVTGVATSDLVAGGANFELTGTGAMAASGTAIFASYNGIATVDDTVVSQNNRLNNTALGLLGGTLNYNSGNVSSSDQVSQIELFGGANSINLTPSTGGSTTLNVTGSIVQPTNSDATILLTGTNLGATPGAGVTNFVDTVSGASSLQIGAGGGSGSTNISILNVAVGCDLALSGNTQYGFVTGLGNANGLRLLNSSTEYATSINSVTDLGSAYRNISLASVANVSAANTTINSLRLDTGGSVAGAGTLNIHSGAILALPGNGGISVANLNFGSQPATITTIGNMNLSSQIATTADFVKGGAGTLVLTSPPLTYAGDTVLNQGTLQINASNQLPVSNVLVLTNGTLDLNGFNQTIGLLRSIATNVSGPQLGSSGAIINSPSHAQSTLTLNGGGIYTGTIGGSGGNNLLLNVDAGIGNVLLTGANSYTGSTKLTSGTLTLDASESYSIATTSNVIPDTPFIDGGRLVMDSKAPSLTQSFNGVTLNPGPTSMVIQTATASPGPLLVNLGGISRNLGSVLSFSNSISATVGVSGFTTTTSNNSNGIIGGYCTINGTDWAVSNGSSSVITPFTNYTNYTWSPGAEVNTSLDTLATNATADSLRFNTNSNSDVNLSGTCVLTSGGILVTANVGTAQDFITGGTLEGAAGADLIINDFNSSKAFEIDSVIADNTSATGLTRSGSGTVILTGANTYTGSTYLDSGTLQISSDGNLGSVALAKPVLLNGGTLSSSATMKLDNAGSNPRAIVVGDNGGGLAGVSSQFTIDGNISGSLPATLAITGSVVLTAANTYSGTITNGGNLTLGNANALQNMTLAGTLGVGFNAGIGTFNLGGLGGSANISMEDGSFAYVSLVVGSNNLNTSFGGDLSGNAACTFTKVGTGILNFTSGNSLAGTLNVNAGTVTLGSTSSIFFNVSKINVAAGALLNANDALSVNPTLTISGTANIGHNTSTGILSRPLTGLTINSGGAVYIASPTAQSARTVLDVSAFTDNGLLDLSGNDMVVVAAGSSGYTTIFNEIAQGRNGGPGAVWTNTIGIVSSAAAANPSNSSLGIELNDNGSGTALTSSFDGLTVHDGDVLVKYTFVGDADLSGTITSADYLLIDNGFNSQGGSNALSGWRNGDFNYDGVINGDDYTLIDNAFNTQGSVSYASVPAEPTEMIASDTEQVASSVPEPGAVMLLAVMSGGLLRRRRR